jgi:hypothetical protein
MFVLGCVRVRRRIMCDVLEFKGFIFRTYVF